MSNVTNEEYIELVEAIVAELRPDKPVKVRVKRINDPRTDRHSEKIAICLDVFRGPTTEVIFNKGDVLGLGELPLQTFITDKLTAIGVHPTEVRRRSLKNVTDAPAVVSEPTAAEAAKVRELLAKRKPAVFVEESLMIDDSPAIGEME